MADFCCLCGEKLPFFGGKMLICANEEQKLCGTCYTKLDAMDNLERGAYLLEHGKPGNPEKMREFIIRYTERTQKKQELEPPTRPCPNCGVKMPLVLKDFRIGAYADSLLGDRYDVDLYACPECGKVEMYTANFAAVKRQAEPAAVKQAEREAAAEKARKLAEEAPARVEQEFVSFHSGRKNEKKPPWER